MGNELISIIVPIYNMEKYLEKCLNSIVNQTYKNLEIILVNDGSRDSSQDICEKFARNDKRIRIIDKENGGQGSARNAGLDIATGNWIGFIDSDDWVDENMYHIMLGHCLSHGADIAICDVFNDCFQDRQEKVQVLEYDDFYKELIYDNISSHPCNKLFRRSLFEKNSHGKVRFPARNSVDDMMIMPAVFDDAHRIVITNVALYCYFNTRTDSVSNSKNTAYLNSYERSIAFQKRYNIAKERGYQTEIVFAKAISFGIGAIGGMTKHGGEYLDEINKFKKYIIDNWRMVYRNKQLNLARKVACIFITINYRLYGKLFGIIKKDNAM